MVQVQPTSIGRTPSLKCRRWQAAGSFNSKLLLPQTPSPKYRRWQAAGSFNSKLLLPRAPSPKYRRWQAAGSFKPNLLLSAKTFPEMPPLASGRMIQIQPTSIAEALPEYRRWQAAGSFISNLRPLVEIPLDQRSRHLAAGCRESRWLPKPLNSSLD